MTLSWHWLLGFVLVIILVVVSLVVGVIVKGFGFIGFGLLFLIFLLFFIVVLGLINILLLALSLGQEVKLSFLGNSFLRYALVERSGGILSWGSLDGNRCVYWAAVGFNVLVEHIPDHRSAEGGCIFLRGVVELRI